MIRPTLALAALALLPASPALGCSRDPSDTVGFPSGVFIASRMAAAAAFVDIAMAEARSPVSVAARNQPFELVHFRTVKRFKGASPDRFTLLAAPLSGTGKDGPTSLEFYVDDQGRIRPYPTRSEPLPPDLGPNNSCFAGHISPETGRRYVVYRDAAGRTLGAVDYYPGVRAASYPVVPASEDQIAHPWTIATYSATRDVPPGSAAPAPIGEARPDVMRLVFRAPQSGASVTRLLRGSGAAPYAVRVNFGEFADETRLPIAYATPLLIDRALADARARLRLASGPAEARRLLAEVKADDPDSQRVIYERGIQLLNAERRLKRARAASPGGITVVDLRGPAEVLGKLATSPLVAGSSVGVTTPSGEPALTPRAVALGPDDYPWGVPQERIVADLRALAGSAR